jgi:hypothetical protein
LPSCQEQLSRKAVECGWFCEFDVGFSDYGLVCVRVNDTDPRSD